MAHSSWLMLVGWWIMVDEFIETVDGCVNMN
jgi:hypothetical protein